MASPNNGRAALDRETILKAFAALSAELERRGIVGELCLFRGTAMMLAFTARVATKDVDALFQPPHLIRAIAKELSEEMFLPEDWLNDCVKGFLSANHVVTPGNLPQFQNLRLTMPVPEYLLAMKCMSSRIAVSKEDASDVADITILIKHLGLQNAEAVLDVVARFYPAAPIPVKTQFLIESLFQEGGV